MLSSIVHPKLLVNLPKIFNSLCTIEPETVTQDPNSGEETITYAPDALMRNIPCYVEPIPAAKEIRRPDQTIVTEAFVIVLKGYYERIDVEDQVRVLTGLQTDVYNILNVYYDDTATHTYLECEKVS